MATQQEILSLILQVEGTSDVAQLAKTIFEVGQSGGEAAPKAQALLEEIAKLSEVSQSTKGLPSLKAQLQEVGDQLFTAKQRAAQLQTEFTATLEPTAALTRNYQRAQQAVAGLESQQRQLGVAILTSENAITAAGLSTENLDAADRSLQGQLAATRAEALSLATAFKESAAAGEKEALTLTEVAERSLVLRTALEQIKVVLGTVGGFIALEAAKKQIDDILATGDKFANFGIEFAAAFGGAQQGAEALSKVKDIAESTPVSLDQVAKAALQARKEGLDPFNGSLLALINANEKFGGSADDLGGVITALGKAVNTGGINIRLLTTLQQAGIPAAQLLGDAIGKTSAQVVDLAKQGKLGADSVQTLIDALAKSGADVAAQKMQTLGAQTQKVRDDFDDFYELIAKSGAYDFVVSKLGEINEAFKKGLADGSLEESAKSISDALITVGNAIIGVTKFFVDHRSAILEVAEAYAVYRGALLAVDLIGAAERMLTLTTATRANAVATAEAAAAQGSYATAMKSNDAAALAAAAEGGGLSKLGNLVKSIPKNVLIAIAVAAAEKDIELATNIYTTLKKNTQLNDEYNATVEETIALRESLVERSAGIEARLQQFANAQIATADQLSAKNAKQSQEYIEQLQNATRYFTALRISSLNAHDFQGVDDATQKLKALGIGIIEAQGHLKDLPDEFTKASKAAGDVSEKFDELRAKGVAAPEAIQGAFKDIDISEPRGLETTLEIIKQVSIRGTEAKNAVQGELISALEKLDGEDLRNFQENVSKKLSEAKGNADELKSALGSALQASLLNLGLSAEQAGEKFTTAGGKIISSFTSVAQNADATGKQIQLAFATGLSKLATSGEVEAIEEQLKAAFDGGRVSADQLSAGMAAAGRKIADIQTAAVVANSALDGTGQVGQSAAQRIVLAFEDARDQLASQASQIAAEINKGLSDGVNVDALKAKLASIEAAIADYGDKIAKAGETGKTGFDRVHASADRARQSTQDAGSAADEAAKKYDRFADTGEQGFADLVQGIANARAGFLSLSEAAASFYDVTLKQAFDAGHTDNGAGFDRVARAMQVALDETTKKIADQRTELTNEIQVINQLGTTANKSLGSFGDDAEKAAGQMENLSKLIQTGNYDAGLLGQQDLACLQQALDAAAQRARSLADAVKQAKDQVTSMEQQLQDDLDSASGNNTAVEDRRFQKQLDDLKTAAQLAGDLNTAEYQQAVANANALHQLKLKQIQQQQDAQNGTNSSGGSGGSTASTAAKAGVSSGVAPTRFVQHVFATPKGKVNALVTENESDGFEEFIRQLAAQKVNSI